jgi:uncharacterized protein (DUF2062 family)
MKESIFYRRLVKPLLELLKQGVTPEKLALSVALGAVLGIAPAFGWTTALCAIIALLWRLNLPAIQIVNYFMYPLQIALILPFFRLGEKLFRAPHLPISVPQIFAMARVSLWDSLRFLWSTTWHAMVVWALVAPILVVLVFVILVPLFRRILRRQNVPLPSPEVKAA